MAFATLLPVPLHDYLSNGVMASLEPLIPTESHEVHPDSPIAPYAYRGIGSGDVERWRPLVASYFTDVDRALCVVAWESGGNPSAKNPSSSARGLFQVMAHVWAPHFGINYDALYDPETNVAIAAQVYQAQGWGAWAAVNRGKC